MTRMYVALKRRLSDKIEDVLEEACVIGDLQTAEELLQVLDFMYARQPRRGGPDRRSRTGRMEQLRNEVERQRRLRANRVFRASGSRAGA
jgi:hypothetical protein